MKSFLKLFFFLFLFASFCSSPFAAGEIYYANGNVGIGTSTPNRRLTVRGGAEFGIPSLPQQGVMLVGSNSGVIPYRAVDFSTTLTLQNTNATNGNFANLLFINSTGRTSAAIVGINKSHNPTQSQGELVFITRNTDSFNEAVRIDKDGNVGIGTNAPASKLDVKGIITAQDLVLGTVVWADYVFEPGYSLMPLSELRRYVKTNKHLPDVPTESELKKSGIAIKKMQELHMKKIEELTLYVLQLEGKISDLNKKIEKLSSSLKK